MDKAELGKKLKEARIKKSYTQEVLAETADIGTMYLSEIERGIKMPSLKIFIKLVEALDISADYVLRDELSSGQAYVLNDITEKLVHLTPAQRKGAVDILEAYIKSLKS